MPGMGGGGGGGGGGIVEWTFGLSLDIPIRSISRVTRAIRGMCRVTGSLSPCVLDAHEEKRIRQSGTEYEIS